MRVFVAWDFSDSAVQALLSGVARYGSAWRVRERAVEWIIPGLNNPRDSGVIGSDIVERRIREADLVIAFLGKGNANVCWEFGLALGLGKPVQLVALRDRPIPTLPALGGISIQRVHQFEDMEAVLQLDDWGVALNPLEPDGRSSCVLCPDGPEGSVLRAAISSERSPALDLAEPSAFKLATHGAELARYTSFVWVVTLEVMPNERDGLRNASNAVIAGFARGAGRAVTILCSRQARQLLDIFGESAEFEGVDEFLVRLRTALAVSSAPLAASPPSLSVVPADALESAALLHQLQRIFRHGADILQLAARVGVHQILSRATPDQVWADVLRQIRNGTGDVGALVEAGLVVEPGNATFSALAARARKILPAPSRAE